MEQAAVGSTERQRQAIARLRRRQLRRQLCREGAQEAFLPKEGEVVGGFTLEARLGAGSYGTVFRARRGERLYALKLLYLPHAGHKAWREVEVLLRLHLARLVEVECHGHYGEHPEAGPLFLYLVTGYVPGLPMDTHVERHNPGAAWAAQAVLALGWQLVVAHSVGVVHRDLKPDNVVVREDGYAVLVDYGVGTFPGALQVSAGRLPNIALLRAPEAWRFQRERKPHEVYEASARDDLWGLGGLLYWLLTGTWPFEGDTEQEVEDAVVHGAPVPPHERNARVPRALSEVCLRMLEKAPEARYPDARAVCGALEAALARADESWEVALCEAWGPENATTRDQETLNLEQALAHDRRVLAYEREHPRRGKPTPTQREPFPSPPDWLEEAVDTRTGAEPRGGPATAPTTGEDTRAVPEVASGGPESVAAQATRVAAPGRVASGRGWGRTLALGTAALLASAQVHSASPVASSAGGAVVPGRSAMSASWVASGQEVAPGWGPPEGGRGAAPAWAATPAPVALTTLPENTTRVKTSRKDASTQHKKQGPVRHAVATTLCTAAVGALAAGCPGAQVRATPPPEACPPGALETMQRLGISTGDDAGSNFPGASPGFVTVREGPGARLVLGDDMGQLEAGSVLTGRLLFGNERVYGRFTEAQRPTGETYRVCLEAWGVWQHAWVRGLPREPNGGPDTAKVIAGPHVRAVERFE